MSENFWRRICKIFLSSLSLAMTDECDASEHLTVEQSSPGKNMTDFLGKAAAPENTIYE
jgi:hypothetical protein